MQTKKPHDPESELTDEAQHPVTGPSCMVGTDMGPAHRAGGPARLPNRAAIRIFEHIPGYAMVDIDADHYRVVEAVLLRDTAEMQKVVARQYAAAAQSDIDELVKEQRDIGTKEQVDAIRRTGACPDARYWLIGSWLLVAVDTALWFVVGARLLTV